MFGVTGSLHYFWSIIHIPPTWRPLFNIWEKRDAQTFGRLLLRILQRFTKFFVYPWFGIDFECLGCIENLTLGLFAENLGWEFELLAAVFIKSHIVLLIFFFLLRVLAKNVIIFYLVVRLGIGGLNVLVIVFLFAGRFENRVRLDGVRNRSWRRLHFIKLLNFRSFHRIHHLWLAFALLCWSTQLQFIVIEVALADLYEGLGLFEDFFLNRFRMRRVVTPLRLKDFQVHFLVISGIDFLDLYCWRRSTNQRLRRISYSSLHFLSLFFFSLFTEIVDV